MDVRGIIERKRKHMLTDIIATAAGYAVTKILKNALS